MPVSARHLIRKMRGGAQSHLIAGEDGEYYVVKFTNNPQHRRILINEWLANAFLRYLQIHVPQTALVQVSADRFWRKIPMSTSLLGRGGNSARAWPAFRLQDVGQSG